MSKAIKGKVFTPQIFLDMGYISFQHLLEIEDYIKIHGRFLQRKEKSRKIEVFEITKVSNLNNSINIELDNSNLLPLKEVQEKFEFLDEFSFQKIVPVFLGD